MSSERKYFIASASGIPCFVNRLNRNRLLVLAYHGIYDGPRKDDLLPATFVHVDDMAEQLQYIKKRYHVIDADELLRFLDNGPRLPHHAALITFDDGYESFYRLAEPVLTSLRIRALVFIPTRYVQKHEPFWFDLAWLFIKCVPSQKHDWLVKALDLECTDLNISAISNLCLDKMKRMVPERRDEIMAYIAQMMLEEPENYGPITRHFSPMREEQLRTLSARGILFGGHTHTHTILSAMPSSLAETEVLVNKRNLERLLDRPCNFFAYPNGGISDFNDNHKKILTRAGYKAAFSLTQRRSLVHDDPMDISRIPIAPEDTLHSLIFRCAGMTQIADRLRQVSSLLHIGKIQNGK